MTEWREQKLEDLAEISSGGTPSRNNPEFWGDQVPWVTPTDITRCETKYLFDTAEAISEKGLAASSAKLLPAGALLMTSRATIGEVRIAARELATNQGFKNLVPKAGTDGLFLYYTLLSEKNQFLRYAAGSTFLEINRRDTGKVLLNVPIDSQVQQKIGRILEAADSAIEKTEALIEKYQQIKAGLMHDLFTRGIDADGKLRPPREQAPELYQETPIGWILKDWDVKPMRAVANYQHGRPFPSTDYSAGGVLLLRPGNLHISGFVVFDGANSTYIPEKWLVDAKGYLVNRGDILMNLTAQSLDDGFLGRVCVHDEPVQALLNQRIARFYPVSVEHKFLYWLLRSHQFRHQIEATCQGTKVQHLYNRDIDRVKFGVPTSSYEQDAISSRLDSITERILCEEKTYLKLQYEKAGLMSDLLSGNVEVANV